MVDEIELPSLDVQKNILAQEYEMWKNTYFQLKIRLRVNRDIGSEQNVLEDIAKQMEKPLKAMESVKKMLDELEDESGRSD